MLYMVDWCNWSGNEVTHLFIVCAFFHLRLSKGSICACQHLCCKHNAHNRTYILLCIGSECLAKHKMHVKRENNFRIMWMNLIANNNNHHVFDVHCAVRFHEFNYQQRHVHCIIVYSITLYFRGNEFATCLKINETK